MLKTVILSVILSSLFLTGCSAFRAIFDESPEQHRAKADRRAAKRERENNSHRFRDPMHDLFKVKNDSPVLSGSDLSPYERRIIDAQRNESSTDIEQIKRDAERSRKARQEWVFGKNPFD
jgi:hypothetical protein